MTTLENTVALLRQLPEEDLLAVNGIVRRLVMRTSEQEVYRSLSEQEFFDRLAVGRKHAEEGKVKSAYEAIEEMRSRYGF